MKRKKMVACLMGLCLVGGVLSGCSAQKTGDVNVHASEEEGASGKYVEEDVKTPKNVQDIMIKNPDRALEVYGIGEGEDGGVKGYVHQEDGSWKEKDMTWLGNQDTLSAIAYAPDGTEYAVMLAKDRMYLCRRVDDKTGEEVALPELEESDVEKMDGVFFPYELKMAFLKNGSLVLTGQKDIRVYDVTTGKRIDKIETQGTNVVSVPMAVNGNFLALPAKDGDGYVVWDEEKKKEIGTCRLTTKLDETKIVLDEEGNLYTLSKKGISHQQTGGSIEEQLMQGDNMTMGSPTNYVADWCIGEKKDFYVLYFDEAGKRMIKHYYFDKNASTKIEHTLNVYSLTENSVVRQAVNDFNKKQDGIEITYKTGAEDADSSREDKIRALNTELLNQNGADILLLDNLPAEEFQKKGILMDLQSILGDKIKDGSIQKNIAACYQEKDGSIYSMPIRYGIPMMRANEEYQKAFASLDTLEKWLEKNPKKSVLGYGAYKGLNRLLLRMYYDEIFDEKGNIRADKCKQLLSVVKEIGNRGKAEEDDGELMEAMDKYTDEIYLSDWWGGDVLAAAEGTGAMISEINSKTAMSMMYATMRDQMNPIEPIKEEFVPRGIVAINTKTQDQETAKKFVEYLFSETAQEQEIAGYGLPMNQKAEQAMIKDTQESVPKDEDCNLVTGYYEENGEERVIESGDPIRSEVEEVFSIADELKEPQKGDDTVLDVFYEEAKLYYGGTQDLDQTIRGITQKIDTYQEE